MDVEKGTIVLSAQVDLAHEGDFDLGAMHVQPSLLEVQIGGEKIALEPRVMQVLVALARERDEVVSKLDLLEWCWEGREVGDDAISRCIVAIRRIAEAGGFEITTIPRVGYRLTEIDGATTETELTKSTDRYGVIPSENKSLVKIVHRPSTYVYGMAAILIVLLALGSWRFLPIGNARSKNPLSIAVLPFDANSQSAKDIAYARSVSESLAARIAMPEHELVSTNQSFQFSGKEKLDAYRKLDATYIVDGSVRRDNGKVVVIVHFDNRKTGDVLFSKSFEAPEGQSLQLSKQVAAAMAFRIRPLSRIDPAKPNQAREMLAHAESMANGDMQSAYAQLAKIAGESTNYGKLQALFAGATAGSLQSLPLKERSARYQTALRQIEMASKMAPRDPQLFLARQRVIPTIDWAKREAVLIEGMKDNSGDPGLLFALGFQELQSGYIEGAHAHLSAATERDPNSFFNFYLALWSMGLLDKQHEVLDLIDRREDLAATRFQRILVTLVKMDVAMNNGDYDTALAMADSPPLNLDEGLGYRRMARLTLVAMKTTQPEDVAAATKVCEDSRTYPKVVDGPCTSFLTQRGDLDSVFTYLNKVVPDMRGATQSEREDHWLRSFDAVSNYQAFYRPTLRPVRADPRFAELADRVGLLDYWRSKGPPDFCKRENAPVCAMVLASKPS